MSIFKRDKSKKKKRSDGLFERVEKDGETLPIMQFYMYTSKDDGQQYIELAAEDAVPQLHYTEVELDAVLSVRKLHIKATYVDAFEKVKFKVYKFRVDDVSVFYV